MRIYKTVLTSIIFFLFSSLIPAQESKENQIQSTIKIIFEYCRKNEFKKANEYFAYTGFDQTRNKKDIFNFDVPEERKKSERICKKINALSALSESYSFGEYEFNNNNYEYSQSIIFKDESQSLTTKFFFIEYNGKFLLVDID